VYWVQAEASMPATTYYHWALTGCVHTWQSNVLRDMYECV